MRRSYARWPAVAIALAGAAVLIYWWRAARPLWVDEELLALNVRDRAFTELLGPLWLDQAAPLGWLALERTALLTFGLTERAMRLLPVLFGLSTLLTCLWIGRRWMTPVGSAILVLLCSIGQWVVFFALEMKHYSADTFLSLLLPALAAWCVEGEAAGGSGVPRRAAVWWAVAAVTLWFSHGALFVTPLCAVVLLTACWWRQGWRVAMRAAVPGLVWLASFGLHYILELRHLLANPYLQNYWAFAFPPASGGMNATMHWWLGIFEPFALKPAGTGRWVLFWMASISGFVFAIWQRRMFGLMLITVPISAALLATLRIVPPNERLGLWIVPALYASVAMAGDAPVWLARRYSNRRPLTALAAAVCLGAIVTLVCADIFRRGQLELEAKPMSNYGLDDRSSVRALLALHRPGDVVMTTHFGLAGLWWYSGSNIAGADAGSQLQDGSPIFEIGHVASHSACDRAQ